jgi:hypothetical protein
MNALNFIADVFFWLIAIWLVLKVVERFLVARNELLAEQLVDMTRQIKEQIIHVNIEKHGSVFYLFEKDTNRFIAQGANFEEVKLHCLTRFKDKTVVADELQMDQLGFK